MAANKGITLVETIVVICIVGVAAAFAIPNLVAAIEQTNAQGARNNLLAISAAQSKYYEDYNAYCLAGCGDSKAGINTNFHLDLSDSFNYSCSAAAETIPYNCQATDGSDTLTLDPNLSPSVSCVNAAGHTGYCPS